MNTIYISGPITGMTDENRQAFYNAEYKLTLEGYAPFNPSYISKYARKDKPNAKWCDFMKEALWHELQCDSIYMLQGWKHSREARIEHFLAKILEMTIIYQGDKD